MTIVSPLNSTVRINNIYIYIYIYVCVYIMFYVQSMNTYLA